MHDGERSWHDDFPITQEAEDFAGETRTFEITCHKGGLGFTVRAVEIGTPGDGYEFAAYSETSPYNALGRVRQKMYRGLATRHLSGPPGAYRMTHEALVGHISLDHAHRALLIVDGIALTLEDLSTILLTHEGWNFRLEISDALE